MKRDVRWLWLIGGVFVGFATWIAVGGFGFLVLRTAWSSYAMAEPTKAYTLPMLFARLAVSVVCTITAGAVSMIVAKHSGAVNWWLGGLLLLISAPIHVGWVWTDYPPWYHVAYLVPLMPLTISGGFLVTIFARKREMRVTATRETRGP